MEIWGWALWLFSAYIRAKYQKVEYWAIHPGSPIAQKFSFFQWMVQFNLPTRDHEEILDKKHFLGGFLCTQSTPILRKFRIQKFHTKWTRTKMFNNTFLVLLMQFDHSLLNFKNSLKNDFSIIFWIFDQKTPKNPQKCMLSDFFGQTQNSFM